MFSYISCMFIAAELLGPLATHDTQFRERVDVCASVVREADAQGVDAALALAVAWSETRMTRAQKPNAFDCVGPMQIKFRYWCPNQDGEWSIHATDGDLGSCDFTARGVFALKYYTTRFKGTHRALCAYGWGECDRPHRHIYVRSTLRTRERIRRLLKTLF